METILKTFWFCLGFGAAAFKESEADDGPCHRGGGKGNCWNDLLISWLILWVNARMTM